MGLTAEQLRTVDLNFSLADNPKLREDQFRRLKANQLPPKKEQAFITWIADAILSGSVTPVTPGIFKRARNLIRAAKKQRAAPRKHVPDEVRKERLSICETCELFEPKKKICQHPNCGCYMERKATWVTSKCPIGRWLPWDGETLVSDATIQRGGTMNINQTFDRVYCVNLDRRKDRWERFENQIPADWPFAPIERVPAIDGKRVPPPVWWNQGGGAWGCYRTHLFLIEQALNQGLNSILLLEDDATFCDGFAKKVAGFLGSVPRNWGMLYLGGQHLFVNQHPPTPVPNREGVYTPYNVNRTHAFALRGKTMLKVYQHLCRIDWSNGHHIDHHLGRFHQRREDPIYCPAEWLIGQGEGKSNINGRNMPERFWANAGELSVDLDALPFVAVLGLHSSGSSCLAGVLHHLGLNLGDKLNGFYGNDPNGNKCGFEAEGLAQICEQAIKTPTIEYAQKKGVIWRNLRGWINARKRVAAATDSIAAGKYPTLCRLGNQLINITGGTLRIVASERPIEDSIKSLSKRMPSVPKQQIASHQQWLHDGKEEIIARLKPDQVIRVPYYELLANPKQWGTRIANFLGLEPDPAQLDAVARWVQPDKRHV